MLDCHCHLTHPQFASDAQQVIDRAKAEGLKAILCVGTSAGDSKKVLSLCNANKNFVYSVIGLSPHDTPSADLKKELAFLAENIEQAVAVGEIGLEYHYFRDASDREKQKNAFVAQLQLAEKFGKPVQIHCRNAHGEIYGILADFPNVNVVMHCFYEPAFLEKSLSLGHVVSIPTLRSKKRDKVINAVPIDRVTAETDSPFLWHDGRNEPKNVADVYHRLAGAKKMPFEEAEETIDSLAGRLYGLW